MTSTGLIVTPDVQCFNRNDNRCISLIVSLWFKKDSFIYTLLQTHKYACNKSSDQSCPLTQDMVMKALIYVVVCTWRSSDEQKLDRWKPELSLWLCVISLCRRDGTGRPAHLLLSDSTEYCGSLTPTDQQKSCFQRHTFTVLHSLCTHTQNYTVIL